MPIRVAIVEDNRELREGLVQLLRATPDCVVAGAFSSCDRLIEQLRPAPPHVVLMDIGLPGLSGIEGARLIKGAFPEIEVLMLTVYEDERRIFDALRAGASGYLLKKARPEQILDAIRDIHAGGAPMTATVARRVLQLFQEQAPAPADGTPLSPREDDILRGLVRGLSYKMIADQYNISIDTVRSHIKHIYEKLHVHSRSEAVAKALRNRLV